MKRRTAKLVIRRSKQWVTECLRVYILNAGPDDREQSLTTLSRALTSLIAAHLELDQPPIAKKWWIDDVEWTQISCHDMEVNGTGRIWWGYRDQPAGEIISTSFEGRMELLKTGRALRYSFVFEHENTKFRICSATD